MTEVAGTGGYLSLQSRFQLVGEDYTAPTDVTLNQLRATSQGGAFEKAMGMPLTQVIPLLSDTAGNIELHLPIRGHLIHGTQLDLNTTVARALREATANALQGTTALSVDVAGAALRRVGEVFVAGVGEVIFRPGADEIPRKARMVLASAATVVGKTPRGNLELIPEIVTDDLRAYGVEHEKKKKGSGLLEAGRAIFGGSTSLDDQARR